MSKLLVLLLVTACALTLPACKKKPSAKETSASAPAPQTAPQAPAGQAAVTPAPPQMPEAGSPATPAADQPLAGQVHPFLTSQLRIFIEQKGRLPTDFGEFAIARLDSVPRAPRGMKWEIDRTTQEVKLVRAE